MSTFGENQVRKFFVATAVHAPRATVSDLAEGEVQAFASTGAWVTATTYDKFFVATKKNGVVYRTEDIVSAQVKRTAKDDSGTIPFLMAASLP